MRLRTETLLPLLALPLLFSCGSGSASGTGPASGGIAGSDTSLGATAGSSGSPAGATAGTSATPSGSGGAAPSAATTCGDVAVEEGLVDVAASDPGIRYVGRLDFSDPDAPRAAFPGVSIETVFEGDAIDLRLKESGAGAATTTSYYDVSVDSDPPFKLTTCREQEVYPLARDLGDGTHHVRISKRTEAQVGTATFLGFRVREGAALSRPDAPARLLEFVGDSITCGYGNELATEDPDSAPFTSVNENTLLAYGGVAAATLEADYVAVAASGRGMVRNYGGGAGSTAPEFYDFTAPNGAWPAWDASRYTPDAIVINLGTNDFSVGLSAEELATMRENYRQTYTDFLHHLRELHPLATLVAAVGPMMSDSYPTDYRALTSIRSDILSVIDTLTTEGVTNAYFFEFTVQSSPYGEDWHPTLATHQRMADQLVSFLRQTKGW